jgi:hypothetical protein
MLADAVSTSFKSCKTCGKNFPSWVRLSGKTHSLSKRVNCLECAPLGATQRLPYNYKSRLQENTSLREIGNSPDSAYFLGFMATDGNLSKDGRHLTLVQKDYSYLCSLKDRFGLLANVKKYKRKEAWRIQFGSVKVYNWLLEAGLFPNKSLTLGKLKFDYNYKWDFLRGVLDGDGTISKAVVSKEGKSYQIWRLRFLSSSEPFIRFLGELTKDLQPPVILKDTSRRNPIWSLVFYGKRSIPLIDRLYQQDSFCLQRKREICFNLKNYFVGPQSKGLAAT